MTSNLIDLYRELLVVLRAGQPAVVATIARTVGSTPQKVGAKMLVLADGRTVGTVGGGCVEAEVWQRAQTLLTRGGAEMCTFGLTEETGGMMACGGRVTFLLEVVEPNGLLLYKTLVDCFEAKEPMTLVTVVKEGDSPVCATQKALLRGGGESSGALHPAPLGEFARGVAEDALRDGEPQLVEARLGDSPEAAPALVFVEPFVSQPTLLIVGAGHVGQALAHLGKWLGFEVAVLDNRPQFVTAERFPDADTLLVEEFVPGLRTFPTTPATFIVLVTRGHEWDEACLRAVVDTPAAYIGMIGSRRRVALVLQRLREVGVSEEKLSRVHTPIGLDIGAVTVQEIAVSIAAELIAVRRKGRN